MLTDQTLTSIYYYAREKENRLPPEWGAGGNN